MKKSNTKLVIFLSFSIVLLLLVALIAIAIKSISHSQQQVLALKNDSVIESLVYDMRDAAHKRSLLIFRMVATDDPFDRDQLWMEFSGLAQNFIKSKNTLDDAKFSSQAKLYFNEALQSAGPGAIAQNNAIRILIDEENSEGAKEILTTDVIPIQLSVMNNLTKLLESARMNIDNSISDLSLDNNNAITLISILGGIAVLLGSIIAIYVFKHTMRSEQDFIVQKEIAEEASNAKSMFLANMSHEIRSPLTAIIGFSDSILHRNLSDEKKIELTRSITRNSQHLHQIINNILDISKIEAGQLDIETISTPISTILNEVNSMVGLQAKKKDLCFCINYSFPLPEYINTDPTRLKQILINLSNNAIKFTNEGCVEINVSYHEKMKQMHFSVTDSGIGMTEDQVNNVFSAFAQADSSTTRQFGGTGLGLSISKQLTELLGGKISCKSQIDKGSIFSFYIDAGDLENINLLINKKDLEIETSAKSIDLSEQLTGHILLAEDTQDNQDLIEMYVTDTGATITIVENGQLAVEACQQNNFDLIFMDMQMPVMDGTEAITMIRTLNIQTPIISLTANAMKADMDKCFNAGANQFLTKPIDVNRFNEVLVKYLKQDKPNNEKEDSKKNKSVQMTKIINRFLDDLPRRVQVINDSYKNKNWREIESETHKLKGLGTAMGFPELTQICEEINTCCNDEYYEPVTGLVAELNSLTKNIL